MLEYDNDLFHFTIFEGSWWRADFLILSCLDPTLYHNCLKDEFGLIDESFSFSPNLSFRTYFIMIDSCSFLFLKSWPFARYYKNNLSAKSWLSRLSMILAISDGSLLSFKMTLDINFHLFWLCSFTGNEDFLSKFMWGIPYTGLDPSIKWFNNSSLFFLCNSLFDLIFSYISSGVYTIFSSTSLTYNITSILDPWLFKDVY